jgi:uncharacterized SAM-binding protein YcdF (DUF218 family)
MTKLLSLLLFPLSQALLLGLLALLFMVFHWRRAALTTLSLGLLWLYLCSTALVADFMMATLEKDIRPKGISVIAEADAIVVLGGAISGDTHLGTSPNLNQHADRLLHAAALYKAGKAPFLLLSGGAEPDARPEAQLMKEVLEVMGVPGRAMVLERNSRNTHENALYSALLLNNKGAQQILLVTSAFHMRRARSLFEAQGFTVIPAPTDYQRPVVPPTVPGFLPTADDLVRTTTALKEHVGYWVYRWRGWI